MLAFVRSGMEGLTTVPHILGNLELAGTRAKSLLGKG